MAYAHNIPRTVASIVESTFADTTVDFDSNGVEFFALSPGLDVSGLRQAVVPNDNYRQRPDGFHPMVRGLKSGTTVSWKEYLTGSGANAAEAGTSVATQLANHIKCAMGGLHLGHSIGFAGGTVSAPTIDSDPGFEQGDWIYCYDASAGVGQFYRIEGISSTTLTLDRDLHFTPDAADSIKGVLDLYWHKDGLTVPGDADNDTLAIIAKGEDAEDCFACYGVGVSMTIDPIVQGEPVTVGFEGMVTTFLHESLTVPNLTGSPTGEAPLVAGTGTSTYFMWATKSGDYADADAFKVEPKIGIKRAPVTGPNGTEGIHGYTATGFGENGLMVSVPFEEDYATEFRARTERKAIVQVGNGATGVVGIVFPRLEYKVDPTRGVQTELTSREIEFRALEENDSAGSLTGDSLEKWRSSMHVLIVA
jgi:hypothetical protein